VRLKRTSAVVLVQFQLYRPPLFDYRVPRKDSVMECFLRAIQNGQRLLKDRRGYNCIVGFATETVIDIGPVCATLV
jgi:hypothetical protein